MLLVVGFEHRRIQQHKVFKGIATCDKGSTGWSFSFNPHRVDSDSGGSLVVYLTSANRHELIALPKLIKRLFGKLFGDIAYLSQVLFEQLMVQGFQLITKLKTNMRNKLMCRS